MPALHMKGIESRYLSENVGEVLEELLLDRQPGLCCSVFTPRAGAAGGLIKVARGQVRGTLCLTDNIALHDLGSSVRWVARCLCG